jgi:biopolymer transport protein ExbD
MKHTHFEETKVPISSLIDVIFLLIMFFVITSVIGSDSEIPVNMTKTENMRAGNAPPLRVLITVQEDGSVFVDNMRSLSMADLEKEMAERLNKYGNGTVAIIRGDAQAKHKEIAEVMEALKESGVRKIRINAELAE